MWVNEHGQIIGKGSKQGITTHLTKDSIFHYSWTSGQTKLACLAPSHRSNNYYVCHWAAMHVDQSCACDKKNTTTTPNVVWYIFCTYSICFTTTLSPSQSTPISWLKSADNIHIVIQHNSCIYYIVNYCTSILTTYVNLNRMGRQPKN
jgi:hypothetical protein